MKEEEKYLFIEQEEINCLNTENTQLISVPFKNALM